MKIKLFNSSRDKHVTVMCKQPRFDLSKEEFEIFLRDVLNQAKRLNIEIKKDDNVVKKYFFGDDIA